MSCSSQTTRSCSRTAISDIRSAGCRRKSSICFRRSRPGEEMTGEPQATTIIKCLPPEEVGEELAGWYIIYLDADGTSYDAIGPYDSEDEAKRILKETIST